MSLNSSVVVRRSLHSTSSSGNPSELRYNSNVDDKYNQYQSPKAEDFQLPVDAEGDLESERFSYSNLQIFSFLVVVVYSICAYWCDFQRAKFLFYVEVAGLTYCIAKVMCIKGSSQIKSIKEHALLIWGKRAFRITVFTIALFAFAAVVAERIYFEPERFQSLIGLAVIVLSSYLASWKRKEVNWRPVMWGLGLQFVFGLIILRTSVGIQAFEFLGNQISRLLKYTNMGSEFVFSYLAIGSPENNLFPVFAFSILPTVIFFSALVSILYYFGILQRIITVISNAMSCTLGTSASESLNAAGNIFVGQTEAPLLIRPFIKDMTMSEIHACQTGGFATIAGGVMAIYIGFGISATHLIAASVLSAPAALAISKLIYPETEESPTRAGTKYVIEGGSESNVIEAAANGAAVAVQLAANIAGMLIAFLALIEMLNVWIGYFGSLVNWPEASFVVLCGYAFYPVAWLIGCPSKDCFNVGKLLGYKIFINEFVAYENLRLLTADKILSDRAITICTYALCGFANFGSIGITLGGLTPLAPERRGDLAKTVVSAMLAGNLACFMTACVAGLLYEP